MYLKFFLISILVAILFGCRQTTQAAKQKTIKIGVVASLSGPASEQGKNWLNGAKLAVSELIQQGDSIELVIEDDQTNASKAAQAFTKLATVDQVEAVLGGTWDFLAESIYPLAKQYQIPFITPTNPVELIGDTHKDNSYIFTNGLSIASEQIVALDFIRRMQVKRVANLFPILPWGEVHRQMLDQIAKAQDLEIVLSEGFNMESYPDILKNLALKIARINPDLVFAPISYDGIDSLIREISRLKCDPLILVSQHLDQAFKLTNLPKLYQRAYGIYPEHADISHSDERTARFNKHYLDYFGEGPRVYAVEGYDAIGFLAKALKSRVIFQSDAQKFEYQGLSSVYHLPADNHELTRVPAKIMTTATGIFSAWDPVVVGSH